MEIFIEYCIVWPFTDDKNLLYTNKDIIKYITAIENILIEELLELGKNWLRLQASVF